MTTTLQPPKISTRSGWLVLLQVLLVALVAPALLAIFARWLLGF